MEKIYNKREVAEVLSKSSHYLNSLKKQGLLFFVKTDECGRRSYTEKDIELIFLIRYLRSIHMPTYEVRRFLELTLLGPSTLDERCHMLRDLDRDLKRKEQGIRKHRKYCDLLCSSLLKNNEFVANEFKDYLNISYIDSVRKRPRSPYTSDGIPFALLFASEE